MPQWSVEGDFGPTTVGGPGTGKMRRLIIFKTGEDVTPLHPGTITYHRVTDSYPICPKGGGQECWAVEYDDGDISDPLVDPIVVGAYVPESGDADSRVIWKDAVWKTATRPQLDVLIALADSMRPRKTGEI